MSNSLTIEEMRLSPNAKRAAHWVKNAHPDIVFTSGRRSARDQAHAMAVNVHRYGMVWLHDTYKNQDMVDSLTRWMTAHLDLTSDVASIAQGFYETLMTEQVGQLAQFPHCRGDAFDIACPTYADGNINELAVLAIRRAIEQVPIECGLQLVLTHEGAHRIIHAQFAPSAEV